MDNDIHPVIRLLAARKQSHPEEFEMTMHENTLVPQYAETSRWHNELSQLGWYMTEAEKALIYPERREKVFGVIHNAVMKKLITGEGRE